MVVVAHELYQMRPVDPPKAEAVRFTWDTAEEVAEWMRRRLGAPFDYPPINITVETYDEGPRILAPASSGWHSYRPGWVLHTGGGKFLSLSDEEFSRGWERAPEPADPSLCHCLSPQVYGVADGDGPMVWDKDCKLCGKLLTPEALASVTADAR
jgi:hypothetical protein